MLIRCLVEKPSINKMIRQQALKVALKVHRHKLHSRLPSKKRVLKLLLPLHKKFKMVCHRCKLMMNQAKPLPMKVQVDLLRLPNSVLEVNKLNCLRLSIS